MIPANFALDRDWTQVPLRSWDHILTDELRHLVTCEEWQDNSDIDITSVVGTMHPDYAGGSWVDLLTYGKRMSDNLTLYEQNPDYYTNANRKLPVMDYASVDGKDWFIGGDGNHRTCIARFGFAGNGAPFALKGISTNLYTIDTGLKQAIDDLRQMLQSRNINAIIRPERAHIGREDGAGWKRDIFQISVTLTAWSFGGMILNRKAVFAALQTIQSEPRLARYIPLYRMRLMERLRRLAHHHQSHTTHNERGTSQ